MAFDRVKDLHAQRTQDIAQKNTYAEYVLTLVSFAKQQTIDKISLQAIEMLNSSVCQMMEHAQTHGPLPTSSTYALAAGSNKTAEEDPSIKFWFPIFFGFYEIVMTCKLEVRSRSGSLAATPLNITRALKYMFQNLKQFGHTFSRNLWQDLLEAVVFPIFKDLQRSRTEVPATAQVQDVIPHDPNAYIPFDSMQGLPKHCRSQRMAVDHLA